MTLEFDWSQTAAVEVWPEECFQDGHHGRATLPMDFGQEGAFPNGEDEDWECKVKREQLLPPILPCDNLALVKTETSPSDGEMPPVQLRRIDTGEMEEILLLGELIPGIRPAKPGVPDISQGLAKQQAKCDLVALEQFLQERLKLMVYQDELYVFEPPSWRHLDKRRAEMLIRKTLWGYDLADSLTQKECRDIRELLLINEDLECEREIEQPPFKLNFVDGTLDLQTGDFKLHDSRDGFFSFVDVKYKDVLHSDCNGDVFEKFADHVGDGDPEVRQQLLELTALALTGYEVKYFYVLLGPSHTGKTQFGRFLEELVGRGNVESVRSVADFGDRWTAGSLAGKKLATCLDLPDAPLPPAAVGIIKQFVGDDPVKGEEKYKKSFTFYRKPLLLFAGNHPIRLANMSKEAALMNRMVTIPFSNPLEERDMIQHLYRELLVEAPYIVKCAIEAFYDLMENKFQATRTELPEEYEAQDARQGYQYVRAFFLQKCSLAAQEETTTEELFLAYCEFAEDVGAPPLKQIPFSRYLTEVIATEGMAVEATKRVKGEERRGYRGIRIRKAVIPET